MLSLRSISKSFAGVQALHDVSLDIERGEIHAIVGENGAGKSTLMRILSGVYPDYDGQVLLDGEPVSFSSPRDAQSHGIGIIHQELNLIRELSVAANIFLGREPRTAWGTIANRRMSRNAGDLLDRLRLPISPERRVGDLRVGEQQMVEIAKALSLDAGILILDEPTSALSGAEITSLFRVIRRLQERGVTMIYISHKFEEIYALSDRVSVLRDGQYIGTRDTASTPQPELIRMMVGRELTDLYPREDAEIGRDVLSVRNLSLRTREDSSQRNLHDISFTLRAGEVVGVAGLMGSGRTELLESIFGVHPGSRRTGTIEINGMPRRIRDPHDAIALGIAFVTEDRKTQSLIMDLPVGQNITLAALGSLTSFGVIRDRKERSAIATAISSMRIRTPGARIAVEKLSGGNQQKVALAKSLLTRPSLLLLDEPTRGIDIGAKAEIYGLVSRLAQQGTGVLMASSELPELLAMCDRILVLGEGRLVTILDAASTDQTEIMEAATSRPGELTPSGV